jgi:hypothetical protein
MLPGSTHVAVGFADLSDLAAAVHKWGLEGTATLSTAAGAAAAAEEDQLKAHPLNAQLQQQQQQQQPPMVEAVAMPGRLYGAGTAGAVDSDSSIAAKARHLLQQVYQLNHEQCSSGGATAAAAVDAAGQPLLWVGYDGSAYAVAKAAVLAEMMLQGADDDAVLQVTCLVTTSYVLWHGMAAAYIQSACVHACVTRSFMKESKLAWLPYIYCTSQSLQVLPLKKIAEEPGLVS